jgi:hypothetical protein
LVFDSTILGRAEMKDSKSKVVPPVVDNAIAQSYGHSGAFEAFKTEAQKAAEHDRAFGQLTPEMEAHHDNEHQAEMRGRQQRPKD